MRRRPGGEDGTVLVLVIGFAFVLVVMVGVVVNVSAVVLAKRGVASAADDAAVSAAQALDLEQLYRDGLRTQLPLSVAEARSRVATYASQVATEQPGLTLAVRVDGRTAVVTAAGERAGAGVVQRARWRRCSARHGLWGRGCADDGLAGVGEHRRGLDAPPRSGRAQGEAEQGLDPAGPDGTEVH